MTQPSCSSLRSSSRQKRSPAAFWENASNELAFPTHQNTTPRNLVSGILSPSMTKDVFSLTPAAIEQPSTAGDAAAAAATAVAHNLPHSLLQHTPALPSPHAGNSKPATTTKQQQQLPDTAQPLSSQRPRRRYAELASERLKGAAAPMDYFKLVTGSKQLGSIKLLKEVTSAGIKRHTAAAGMDDEHPRHTPQGPKPASGKSSSSVKAAAVSSKPATASTSATPAATDAATPKDKVTVTSKAGAGAAAATTTTSSRAAVDKHAQPLLQQPLNIKARESSKRMPNSNQQSQSQGRPRQEEVPQARQQQQQQQKRRSDSGSKNSRPSKQQKPDKGDLQQSSLAGDAGQTPGGGGDMQQPADSNTRQRISQPVAEHIAIPKDMHQHASVQQHPMLQLRCPSPHDANGADEVQVPKSSGNQRCGKRDLSSDDTAVCAGKRLKITRISLDDTPGLSQGTAVHGRMPDPLSMLAAAATHIASQPNYPSGDTTQLTDTPPAVKPSAGQSAAVKPRRGRPPGAKPSKGKPAKGPKPKPATAATGSAVQLMAAQPATTEVIVAEGAAAVTAAVPQAKGAADRQSNSLLGSQQSNARPSRHAAQVASQLIHTQLRPGAAAAKLRHNRQHEEQTHVVLDAASNGHLPEHADDQVIGLAAEQQPEVNQVKAPSLQCSGLPNELDTALQTAADNAHPFSPVTLHATGTTHDQVQGEVGHQGSLLSTTGIMQGDATGTIAVSRLGAVDVTHDQDGATVQAQHADGHLMGLKQGTAHSGSAAPNPSAGKLQAAVVSPLSIGARPNVTSSTDMAILDPFIAAGLVPPTHPPMLPPLAPATSTSDVSCGVNPSSTGQAGARPNPSVNQATIDTAGRAAAGTAPWEPMRRHGLTPIAEEPATATYGLNLTPAGSSQRLSVTTQATPYTAGMGFTPGMNTAQCLHSQHALPSNGMGACGNGSGNRLPSTARPWSTPRAPGQPLQLLPPAPVIRIKTSGSPPPSQPPIGSQQIGLNWPTSQAGYQPAPGNTLTPAPGFGLHSQGFGDPGNGMSTQLPAPPPSYMMWPQTTAYHPSSLVDGGGGQQWPMQGGSSADVAPRMDQQSGSDAPPGAGCPLPGLPAFTPQYRSNPDLSLTPQPGLYLGGPGQGPAWGQAQDGSMQQQLPQFSTSTTANQDQSSMWQPPPQSSVRSLPMGMRHSPVQQRSRPLPQTCVPDGQQLTGMPANNTQQQQHPFSNNATAQGSTYSVPAWSLPTSEITGYAAGAAGATSTGTAAPGTSAAVGAQLPAQGATQLAADVGPSNASQLQLEADDQWTEDQVKALQAAYFKVEPTHPFFWQEVARHVPGRTATQCFSKMFDAHKSPEERAKAPKRRQLAKAVAIPQVSSRMQGMLVVHCFLEQLVVGVPDRIHSVLYVDSVAKHGKQCKAVNSFVA